MTRQAELIYQEARRRRAVAKLDEPRRSEHLEVPRALERAARIMETQAGKRTPRMRKT